MSMRPKRNAGLRVSHLECDVLWKVLDAVGRGNVPTLDASERAKLGAVYDRLAVLRYGPGGDRERTRG